MRDFLYKYGLLNIIPSEQFSFFSQKLPKKIKLTDELVKLNYQKYSPYKNPEIYYFVTNNQVLIWFAEKRNSNAYVQIPQSYLLYKQLLKLNKDAVYILQHKKLYSVFVIKDQMLLDTYTLEIFDKTLEETIKHQYGIDQFVLFDRAKTLLYEQNAHKFIGLKELEGFLVYKLNRKTLLNKVLEFSWLPISLVLLTLIVVNAMQGIYLEQKNEKILIELESAKKQNDTLKQTIQSYNSKIQDLNEYALNEFKSINPLYVLQQLYTLLKNDKDTSLKSLNISDNTLSLQIYSKKESVELLNQLNGLSCVKKVVFKGRVEGKTMYQREILPVVLFEIELKSQKE